MTDKVSYTVVNHTARVALGLSMNDYIIADIIYNLSNNPESAVVGWCHASKDYFADFIGVGRATIFRSIKKLTSKGLVEKSNNKLSLLRTTKKWYQAVVILKNSQNESVNKSKVSLRYGESQNDTGSIKMIPNKYINNTNTNIILNPNINTNTHTLGDAEKNKKIIIKRNISLEDTYKSEVLEEIAKKYNVTVKFVEYQRECLSNYVQSSGRHYKDYVAALRNFVLRGMKDIAEKERYKPKKIGIDASNL